MAAATPSVAKVAVLRESYRAETANPASRVSTSGSCAGPVVASARRLVVHVAQPNLCRPTDVHSEIDASTEIDESVFRNPVTVNVDILGASDTEECGLHEVPLRNVERLVKAGREQRLVSQLDVIAPLASSGIQPVTRMLHAEQEVQVSSARCVHAEARPDDVGSNRGFRRQPDEGRVRKIALEPVRDRFDVVESRHLARVRTDRCDVDGIARTNPHERPQVIRIHAIEPLDPDIRNPRLDCLLRGDALPPGQILMLGYSEGCQAIHDEAGR